MNPIVIIGSGLAGYTLAKEFRKLDRNTPLHIITADDGAFYSKPMLSNALAKGKSAVELATANATSMAAELDATIWTEQTVSDIDTESHIVSVGGKSVTYSKLVLAVGAQPIRPPLAGDAADAVLSVNNLADYARFRSVADTASSIAVIGPGLIGCEFANDFAAAGKQVTVIGPDTQPLGRLLPNEAGAMLRDALTNIGVQWRLGKVAEAVNREGNQYRITLSDGSELVADAVLSAIGLRSNTQLAAMARLEVGRGIIVDRQLQSSVADVYAIGDCAEVEGLVLPFVMPLMNQARALAKTLAGNATEVSYPAMPVAVKTPAHAVVVAPPAPEAKGAWEVDSQPDGVRALYRGENSTLLGFALTGNCVTEKQALAKELPAALA